MPEDMQVQLEGIKTEMTGMQHRLGHIEQDMSEVKLRLGTSETTLRNVVVEQARARGDIEWLKANTVTRDEFKNGLGLILDRIDGLSGKFEDARYGSAKNADRLSDHEARLLRLERDAKPS